MSLKHRYLLPPSETFIEGMFKYAVYDYSKTDNLESYLKKKGKVTQEELFGILKEIIDTYEFIQRKGLVHGNINPRSILIYQTDDLTIKLTDFMLYLDKKKDLSKDEYIAPEVSSKEKKPNTISDVYSIGAIMKLLLKSTDVSNEGFRKLVEDCLQTDPNKRIQFDALALHPYFTSIYPVYKFLHSNLLFYNIRLLLRLYLR